MPNEQIQGATEQPKPKNRRLLWWLVAATAAALLAIGMWLVGQLSRSPQNEAAVLELLEQKGSSLTQTNLDQLDKTNLFYAVFKKLNTQQVTRLKTDTYYQAYQSGQPALTGDNHYRKDITFNYQTKQVALQNDTVSSRSGDVSATRCYLGKLYSGVAKSGATNVETWQAGSLGEGKDYQQRCGDETGKLAEKGLRNITPGDGLATGGMSAQQAEAFGQALKSYGVIEVADAKLVNRKNKPYIRLEVNVVPQRIEGAFWGMQTFAWSFQESGLDPALHPYAYNGIGGGGMKVVYYVDPTTQLPVYSQLEATPVLEDNGQPKSEQSDLVQQQAEYEFPASVTPLPLENRGTITFSWLDHEK